jgi:tRNA nucleotidyltransferase (CCA-adding enzyme)
MPDYMFLLESRLSPEQRAVLERVQELSRSQELNVYLTGGAVRDLISGQTIRDLDFTVEGNPVRMVRELEKGGARVTSESEKLRHYEMMFAGDVDGSISGAREDVYERPGAKPDHKFSGIMEDLRRRDFSVNAIAISLNAQSRGLLIDPMNGLADLEKQEIRSLSIHGFTNQPARILRILRYCARMTFKMESRTQEWFELAIERGLHKTLDSGAVGQEVLALAYDDNPAATLKAWEQRGLLEAVHPQLQRRKPDYDSLNKLARVRGNLMGYGVRPRSNVAVVYYIFGRLKPREASAAMRHLEFRQAEIDAVANLVPEAQKVVAMLKGRKTNAPRDAFQYIASLPAEVLAFIEVELPNSKALSKVRNYFQKWRPMRGSLPAGELEALGIARGPKFDKILEQIFDMQLRGRARTPEDRTKALRSLAGIKEEPKKKPEKPVKKGKGGAAEAPALVPGAKQADKAGQRLATPSAAGVGAGNSGRAQVAPSRSAAAAIGAKAQVKFDTAAAGDKGKKKSAAHSASKNRAKAKPAKKARR